MIAEINEINGLNELRTWMFSLGLASYSIYSLIKSIAIYRYNRQFTDYKRKINTELYKDNNLENLIDDYIGRQ